MSRAHTTDEQSLGQLVAAASRDVSAIVRGEVALAKAELRREVQRALVGSILFAAAAVLGVFMLIMLSVAAAFGIRALGVTLGWSFLIVAGAYLLLALVLAVLGLLRLRRIKGPQRTILTAKQGMTTLRNSRRPDGTIGRSGA